MLLIIAKLSNNLAYKIAISFSDSHTGRKDESDDNLIGLCSYLSYYESRLINYPRLILEDNIPSGMVEFYQTLIGKVTEHM